MGGVMFVSSNFALASNYFDEGTTGWTTIGGHGQSLYLDDAEAINTMTADPIGYDVCVHYTDADANGYISVAIFNNAGFATLYVVDAGTHTVPSTSGQFCYSGTVYFLATINQGSPYRLGIEASNMDSLSMTGDDYLRVYDGGGYVPGDTTTHIVEMLPANNSTTTSAGSTTPIDISLHAYINPDDLTTIKGVLIELENIDQNVIFSNLLSFFGASNTQTLFYGSATTSGDFYFATTTDLPDGNYRIHATLDAEYFGMFTFFNNYDEQSNQFIVGTSTWLGNIAQTTFSESQDFYGALQATSSSAMAGTCSPFSSAFGIRECLSFLFVPDTEQLTSTMESFRDGVLVRIPWGYVTRVYDIFTASTTEALPVISYEFDDRGGMAGVVWEIDPGDMIAGAGTLLDSVEDRNGNTIRDVMEIMVKSLIALAVVFTIVSDVMGAHKHKNEERNQST